MAGSVLIIDAEEDFANQLAGMLREEGIEPVVTGDGKVGLDLARINLPSAIVLCVELPRMSGYSICAKLKKDAALKGVPLIITSAEATPETFEHHKKLKTRAEEYLKKPFAPSQLIQVLSQYVSYTPGAATNGSEPTTGEELSIDDQAPQMLRDDEAFSAEEASSMQRDAPSSRNMTAIDEVLSDLSRPSGITRTTPIDLGQAAGMGDTGFEAEDEMMTTVGVLPPSASLPKDSNDEREQELEGEVARLKAELETARSDKARAERERAAAERASTQAVASQTPQASGGREVVALKKELNQKERELLELKEQLNSKEKDILRLRDRETELETQLVQLEDEKAAADSARESAERRADAAEGEREQAEERARAADSKATQAEQRAREADRKAAQAESKATQATQRANQSDQRAQVAEENARNAEARAADIEGEARRTSEDLHQRLSEATAREAELDAALSSMTADAEGLRQGIAQLEQEVGARDEHIDSLRGANQQQTQEIASLTNQLAAATSEAESLRQQLAATEARLEEANARGSNLESELAQARGEIEANGAAIRQLEQDREVAEGRVARAYQKIRDDDKIKGKAKKALEIALALLQEAGYAADAEAPSTETGDVDAVRS